MDLKLLKLLNKNSRVSNEELAVMMGISTSEVESLLNDFENRKTDYKTHNNRRLEKY